MINKVTIDGETEEIEFPDELYEESDIDEVFRENESIPIERLGKYYLNENLNFLCGSGTSVSLGGETINDSDENPFNGVLNELREIDDPKDHIKQLIKYLDSDDLLEDKFDRINQEYLYYLNNVEDEDIAEEIKDYFEKILEQFIEGFIPFPKDYYQSKLEDHTLFINKIISRKEELNRPNIFTLNYDLAFENSCEKIGVSYNNGFRGTHLRKFDPDTFYNERYIKQDKTGKNKKLGTYLNLYKLHGSISWQYSDNLDDLYKIKEVQVSDNFDKDDFNYESLVIYPIQTKKSYSLDLPYSELFRYFSKNLSETQNTLVLVGYSFLDEHINDIIRTGLYNPNLTLIIHAYGIIDDNSGYFGHMVPLISEHIVPLSISDISG
ncbi:SIR2-like domain-containing protein [Fodinibius roseus]|uniref:SIR2-like domain-containing protein n=1 Tax=Fodinibius roseus TaxID=1194090 RepID=A0A1M5JZA1_9BACT|nr:SIR2 family protein [Fodinibius roseus]SHG45838.1 SIR2-like domain-containing protein [Fodinibius roseus]